MGVFFILSRASCSKDIDVPELSAGRLYRARQNLWGRLLMEKTKPPVSTDERLLTLVCYEKFERIETSQFRDCLFYDL